MSGSSKSKNIKHRKEAQDAKRSKAFAKLAKAIVVAVRAGGDDPSKNPQLRAAIQDAKSANMPKDNVQRAIQKAIGGGAGDEHELLFECYARGGVAIVIKCITDNINRTVAAVRMHLRKQGAEIAKAGALQHIFHQRGEVILRADSIDEEAFFEILVANDLDEPQAEGEVYLLQCEASQLAVVEQQLLEEGAVLTKSRQVRIATTRVQMTPERYQGLNDWLTQLAEHDDVAYVLHNASHARLEGEEATLLF